MLSIIVWLGLVVYYMMESNTLQIHCCVLDLTNSTTTVEVLDNVNHAM